MRSRTRLISILLAFGAGMTPNLCSAAALMVGVVPSDGNSMLVKRFSVAAGATILGVEFENNDSRTTFPEVLLVRGIHGSIADGTVVTRAVNVSESTPGIVRAVWPEPVWTSRSEDLYVAVRIPQGAGKRGPGDGPALGANRVSVPNGSFAAGGTDGELTPMGLELSLNLLTAGVGKTDPGVPSARPLQTFLGTGVPNPARAVMRIQFGLESSLEVQLSIYDVSGREVRRLADGKIPAGVYSREWDGRDERGKDVAAGVYIAKLRAGDKVITQKLVLAK